MSHEAAPVCDVLPGFVRLVDDDLRQRLAAHAEGAELPSAWTPEHVQARMVEAYDILHRAGARPGPRFQSGLWPAVLREFADLVDADAQANARESFWSGRGGKITGAEASRMNEALAWCMEHLAEEPLQCDALTLFCWCHASGRDLLPILRARKVRAEGLARVRAASIDGRDPERARMRASIARQLAAETNILLERADTERERRAIRKAARDKMRERCEDGGCAIPVVPLREVMPGVVMARTTLDRMRRRAAARIAAALNVRKIVVR